MAASAASAAALLGFGGPAIAFCCSGGRSAALAASCTPMRPFFTASCNSGSLFDLARCCYHDMADHAAGRLRQFATRCCFWLRNFNYGLGLRAVGGYFCGGRRFHQHVVQVEVLGGGQCVGDRLPGQVAPLEVVRNHQDQRVFTAAFELYIARSDAGALANGRAVSPIQNHSLEQHDASN